jgi:hypothetical protein
MSVWESTLRAKGSVSGSRSQQRDSCSAALPKPASWRYRQTVQVSERCSRYGAWAGVGGATEIVHHIAAEQRHDIVRGAGNVMRAAGGGQRRGGRVLRGRRWRRSCA